MKYKGEKRFLQKAKEKISKVIRGKEKTEHKGLEQDKKTGYYTHKAPKDRMDTEDGRIYYDKIKTLKFGQKTPKRPKGSNDMSYAERKKEIAAEKKEAKRKKAFDKKYVTKKADGGKVMSGSLKAVPASSKGLKKLPTQVRNKMGYMKTGGRVGLKSGGIARRGRGCEIK